MQITVTFNSLEEFYCHMGIAPLPKMPVEGPEKATGEAEEARPEKNAEKKGKTLEVLQGATEDGPAPSAPEVNEGSRVEVRKTLAQLNKKVGKNIASGLIKSFGVDRLTEVALADLPALMEKAKEALNAG